MKCCHYKRSKAIQLTDLQNNVGLPGVYASRNDPLVKASLALIIFLCSALLSPVHAESMPESQPPSEKPEDNTPEASLAEQQVSEDSIDPAEKQPGNKAENESSEEPPAAASEEAEPQGSMAENASPVEPAEAAITKTVTADEEKPENTQADLTDDQQAGKSEEQKAKPKKEKKVAKKLAPNIDLEAVTPALMPDQQSKLADESNLIFLNNGLTCMIPEPLEDQPIVELSDQDLVLLGAKVLPGTSTRLAWTPGVSISGLEIPTPVLVVRGANPGHTLCLTAATHGDELNGIEIIRRVIYDLDPKKLTGTIIGIPIVNLQGFQRGSRYLPDRRDLNRYFPGSPDGSLASRVAYSLFNEIITNCTMLVDFHTGSLRRTNLPQVRADMTNPEVVLLTEGFDEMAVVHSPGGTGMLRNAATDNGIPAVTMEIGESLRLQASQVDVGVQSIFNLLGKELMYPRPFRWGDDKPIYYKSIWLRADQGGILINNIKLGARVNKDDLLGTVTDPITNKRTEIKSTVHGRVIGMAVNQVVMRGYAAFHIGIETSEQDMIDAAQEEPSQDDEIEFINEEVEHELE